MSFPLDPPAAERTSPPAWEESTRPHLASSEPDEAPSARGRAAAQSLVDVHDELRSNLEQVRALVVEVGEGRTSPAGAREVLHQMAVHARDWSTGASCSAYCTLVAQHHLGEDVEVFPYLRRHDSTLAPVLDRLEDEHVVIHDLLDAVDAALVDLITGVPEATDALGAVVDRLADALLSHLAYEERELLGPMSRAFA